MSKMLKITMILVMTFFAIFITPQQRAAANPLAVGGALYLGGAGVYVVGAVGVAALAGLAGCTSCAEDIEAHAQRTWDGSTQIVKDGVQMMVDASIGAWGATSSALTATDASFNTWLDSKLTSFEDIIQTAATLDKLEPINYAVVKNTTYGSVTANLKDNYQYHNGTYVYSHYSIDANNVQGVRIGTNTFRYYVDVGKTRAEVMELMFAVTTLKELMALGASLGGAGYLSHPTVNTTYAKAQMRESWEDMKDAGLVLPVDQARPMFNDMPLTYDPTTDTYAGIDGVTVPHEDVTGFDFGKPHWKTLEDLAALGLTGLGAGLYVDGWAGSDSVTSVYDPVTDTTTTTTTTGTTTNVTTGETVTTGATTTTTTGDTTGTPTTGTTPTTPKTPKDKANRWGALVTTKFPFSLPWDLFFILSFLNAEPKTPVFSIDERINKRENVEGIQIKFDIDLSFLDPYIPWFRRFIVLGFAFFLIMNTRKLLGGAQ